MLKWYAKLELLVKYHVGSFSVQLGSFCRSSFTEIAKMADFVI